MLGASSASFVLWFNKEPWAATPGCWGAPGGEAQARGPLSTPAPCPLNGPQGLGGGEDAEVKDGSWWRAGHGLTGPLACCRFPVFSLKIHKYSSPSSDWHLTGAKPSEGDTQWALMSIVLTHRTFHSQKFSLCLLLTGAPVVPQRGDGGGLKTNSACRPTPSGETALAETCVGGVDPPRYRATLGWTRCGLLWPT